MRWIVTVTVVLGVMWTGCDDTFEPRVQPELLNADTERVVPPFPDDVTRPDTSRDTAPPPPDTVTPPDTIIPPDTVTPPDTIVPPDTVTPPDVPPDVPELCRRDVDCQNSPETPVCYRQEGRCVECVRRRDCLNSPAGPRCDRNTFTCTTPGGGGDCRSTGDCPPDQVCSNFGDPNQPGTCIDACEPYVGSDQSGCSSGTWCTPDIERPGVGQCTPSNPGGDPAPSPCTLTQNPSLQGTCADQNICLPDENGEACFGYCDPAVGPGGVGSCPNPDDACFQFQYEDDAGQLRETAYGICFPGCDVDLGVGCDTPGQACVIGELLGLSPGQDLCYDVPAELGEGEDCSAVGMQEFELCGSNSMCIDLQGGDGRFGVLCYDICRAGVAPIGSANHPDCRNPGAICVEAFDPNQTTDIGLCILQ